MPMNSDLQHIKRTTALTSPNLNDSYDAATAWLCGLRFIDLNVTYHTALRPTAAVVTNVTVSAHQR